MIIRYNSFFFLLQKYQVSFSMLEIYNEQVRDLLVKTNPKGGLQVRLNYSNFFVGLLCASMQVTNICQRFSP